MRDMHVPPLTGNLPRMEIIGYCEWDGFDRKGQWCWSHQENSTELTWLMTHSYGRSRKEVVISGFKFDMFCGVFLMAYCNAACCCVKDSSARLDGENGFLRSTLPEEEGTTQAIGPIQPQSQILISFHFPTAQTPVTWQSARRGWATHVRRLRSLHNKLFFL